MILIVHALVGAALGSKIHNLWIVSIASVVIHFLLDRLPHWDYGPGDKWNKLSVGGLLFFGLKIFIDFVTVVLTIYWLLTLSPANSRYILAGVFFSLLPDGLALLYCLDSILFKRQIKILTNYFLLHDANHISENKNSLFLGILIVSLIMLISIYLVLH